MTFSRDDAAMLADAARKAPLSNMSAAEQLNDCLRRFVDFIDDVLPEDPGNLVPLPDKDTG